MENKKIKIILGIMAIIVVAGLAGFYIYKDASEREEKPEVMQNNTQTIDEHITTDVEGTADDEDNGYTIEIVPSDEVMADIEIPDLDRKIAFGVNISSEAKDIITDNVEKLVQELKENSDLFEGWIRLGLQLKIAGDYQWARDVWEYASAIRPHNSLSFRNLGDLYGYYLNDYQKAEENFLKAIENDPNKIEYYFKLSAFYRDVLKDIAKARDVVRKGIDANPSSEELKTLLQSLK